MYTGNNIIIIELQKNFRSEWPRFYCDFNTWKIPDELSHLDMFKGKEKREYGETVPEITEAMAYISDELGEYEISKYWNLCYRTDDNKMNEKDFELWWNYTWKEKKNMKRQKGNSEAWKRNRVMTFKKRDNIRAIVIIILVVVLISLFLS